MHIVAFGHTCLVIVLPERPNTHGHAKALLQFAVVATTCTTCLQLHHITYFKVFGNTCSTLNLWRTRKAVVYTWTHEGKVGQTRMLCEETAPLVLQPCPDAGGVRTARGPEALSRTCLLKRPATPLYGSLRLSSSVTVQNGTISTLS
eukprot:scaffold726_cov371-Pavlova_lutheri.AAC.5